MNFWPCTSRTANDTSGFPGAIFLTIFSIKKSVKLVIGTLCFFVIPGALMALAGSLRLLGGAPAILIPLAAGFGAGLLLYLLLFRKWNWLATFMHELSHALVALLFLRRIRSFVVTARRGGQVRHSEGFGGETGNLLILLAPYYLPVLFVAAVLCRPLAPTGWFPWYDGAAGFLFAFHLLGNAGEIRQNWTKKQFRTLTGNRAQTDIGRAGYLFAALVIAALTFLLYALLFTLLTRGYPGLPGVLTTVWKYGAATLLFFYNTFLKIILYLAGLFSGK